MVVVSKMLGCFCKHESISLGEIFTPPFITISLDLSMKKIEPFLNIAKSPVLK